MVFSDNQYGLTIVKFDEKNQEVIALYPQKSFHIWRLLAIEHPHTYSNILPKEIISLAIESEEKFNIEDQEKLIAEIPVEFGKIIISAINRTIMDAQINFYYEIGDKKYLLNEIYGHLTYFKTIEDKVILGTIGYGGSGYTSEISIYSINSILSSLRLIVPGRPLSQYHFDNIIINESSVELIDLIHQKYDDQLNDVYQNILQSLDSEVKQEELRIAQRAWLNYLTNHISAIMIREYRIEIQSAITDLERCRLISGRIDELLRNYLSGSNIIN